MGEIKRNGNKVKIKFAVVVVLFFISSLLGFYIFKKLGFLAKAVGPVNVYFEPANLTLPPDTNLKVMIDANTYEVAFVRVEFTFDPTIVNLTQEIQTTAFLGTLIQKTSMHEANTTGNIVVVLGLSPGALAPTGVFELAQLSLTSIASQSNLNTTLSVIDQNVQIVDVNAVELSITSNTADLVVNPQASTPTPTILPTSSPLPSLSPQPTISPSPSASPLGSPSASLTLNSSGPFLENKEFDVTIDFSTNTHVSGVDAVVLFDPSQLTVNRVSDAKLLHDTTIIDVNNGSGVVKVSQVEPPGASFLGTGAIASITFLPKVVGNVDISFDYVQGSKAESNAIEYATGSDILTPPSSLSLNIEVLTLLQLKLDTPSENQTIGHTVTGDVTSEDGTWSQVFSTDKDGLSDQYTLSNTFVGKLSGFLVKVSGFLKRRFSFLVNSGVNLYDVGSLVGGDLNDDGIINNIDLSLMYASWFSAGLADFNRDGIINSADHWVLTQNFFKTDE